MSVGHFEILPTVALELAVTLDRYRQAARMLAIAPDDDAACQCASDALRSAGPLAFALPAIWPSWGEMVVRHAALVQQGITAGTGAELQDAWRHLEDGVENVMQRCVEWALRRQAHSLVPEPLAQAFLAWDRARSEAFGLERQLAAMEDDGAGAPRADACEHLLQRFHDVTLATSHFLGDALAALQGRAASDSGEHRDLREFEALHEQWRLAEDASATAEIAILQLDLKGLPVPEALRVRAVALRNAARYCRQAVLKAGQL